MGRGAALASRKPVVLWRHKKDGNGQSVVEEAERFHAGKGSRDAALDSARTMAQREATTFSVEDTEAGEILGVFHADGSSLIPAPKEPRRAYVAVVEEGGYRLGVAVEGENGYHPVREDSDVGGLFGTYDEADSIAKKMNEGLGLDPREVTKIVISTMRGPGLRRTRRSRG